ncbi:MAG: hypothetical protein ACE15C_17875 [Phycisphaerae bacterium]
MKESTAEATFADPRRSYTAAFDWIARAEASGITMLKRSAHRLKVYRFGLLA